MVSVWFLFGRDKIERRLVSLCFLFTVFTVLIQKENSFSFVFITVVWKSKNGNVYFYFLMTVYTAIPSGLKNVALFIWNRSFILKRMNSKRRK